MCVFCCLLCSEMVIAAETIANSALAPPFVCLYVCAFVSMYICSCVWLYECVDVYIFVYGHVHLET